MKEDKFGSNFSERLAQSKKTKAATISVATAGILAGCSIDTNDKTQKVAVRHLDKEIKPQQFIIPRTITIPDSKELATRFLDNTELVLTARGETVAVINRVPGGLNSRTNFLTENEATPCDQDGYLAFVQDNDLYQKYLKDTGVIFTSFERTTSLGQLVGDSQQVSLMAYRKPNNEIGWTRAIPSDHTDLTNQLISRAEPYGIVNQVLKDQSVRQAVIRCVCGNPVEEQQKIPAQPTDTLYIQERPTPVIQTATPYILSPERPTPIILRPTPVVIYPTPEYRVSPPPPEFLVPLPPRPPELIPPPLQGLPPTGRALIFKHIDVNGNNIFDDSVDQAAGSRYSFRYEIVYQDPIGGLKEEVVKVGGGWLSGNLNFPCPPPGIEPIRYFVRETSAGGLNLVAGRDFGHICTNEHAEFWNQLVIIPTPFVPLPTSSTIPTIPTRVTEFTPTPINTPTVPGRTPETPTIPILTNTPETPGIPSSTPSVNTPTVPGRTSTPEIPASPTPAGTNTETLPTKTQGLTATLVNTRTPGADTPTIERTNTPVPPTNTVRIIPPTAAPTNTEALSTKTQGATATLAPTRTQERFTPTALGTPRNVNPNSVPVAPTAPRPSNNKIFAEGDIYNANFADYRSEDGFDGYTTQTSDNIQSNDLMTKDIIKDPGVLGGLVLVALSAYTAKLLRRK